MQYFAEVIQISASDTTAWSFIRSHRNFCTIAEFGPKSSLPCVPACSSELLTSTTRKAPTWLGPLPEPSSPPAAEMTSDNYFRQLQHSTIQRMPVVVDIHKTRKDASHMCWQLAGKLWNTMTFSMGWQHAPAVQFKLLFDQQTGQYNLTNAHHKATE